MNAVRSTFGPLTRTDFVRYQGAAGDMNPIHHDAEAARAAGFSDVISVGMLQASALANSVCAAFGPENTRRLSFRFTRPVYPGDSLLCTATIERRYAHDGEARIDLALACQSDAGVNVIEGHATFARATRDGGHREEEG
jgi:acyl dehydratase